MEEDDTNGPTRPWGLDNNQHKFDARYPNQNQTNACGEYFLQYKRCVKAYPPEEDKNPCWKLEYRARDYCPIDWIEKWEEQIGKGTFPHKI